MSSLIKIDILTQLQCAGICLLVMLFLTLWRIRKRKSLLSLEYTHELLLWAFFAGFTLILFFLITIQVVFPAKEIIAKFPWATITTLFAAPFLLIAFYWKHLQTISDRFIPASELIYDELPKKRVSGYLQLERVSVENLSLVPTVVELLSQNIQYMPNDSPDLKYALDILSRIWQYHSTRWKFTENLEPDLRKVDLSGLELYSVYLKQFFLEKSDFSDCYLRKANFNKAILWHANFSNADLTGATFVDAKIQGANFSGAKLTQAQVDSVKEGSLTTILPENLHPPESWGHWCDSNRESCFLKKDCSQYLCRNNEDPSSFLKIEADEKNS